jgi:hypothetical protein
LKKELQGLLCKKGYFGINDQKIVDNSPTLKHDGQEERNFCGDTLNTFAREDPKYHWSRAYKHYSTFRLKKEILMIFGYLELLRQGVPEVFDATELVIWCTDNYEKNQRIIQLQGQSLISLVPSTFSRMLRLPEPTMTFKAEEAKDFMKSRNGGWDLLPQYLEDPTTMPEDISTIQVSQLRKPYQDMAWILARILGQESTATIPCLSLYILYFSIQKKAIFDWSKIISSEISFQLSNFKRDKKFYMSTYLIFSIVYCHVFQGLHLAK